MFHLLKVRMSIDIFSTEKCKVTFVLKYRTVTLRKHPHMFHTPSFTFLYSRKGEMRGTQNEGLFLVLTRMGKEDVVT